mmetsp:Transcript_123824/g.194223  ORF Transcript_123824/g.194223 Transcript_123824/m.194223 type:complete len:446 (-) Transcript_123824:61-1398(-)
MDVSAQPERNAWVTSALRTRTSMCLAITYDASEDAFTIEDALRLITWGERDLEWHDVVFADSLGCGFVSNDMYSEFSDSAQSDLPHVVMKHDRSTPPNSSAVFKICCSISCLDGEARNTSAGSLLTQLRRHLEASSAVCILRIQILLTSHAPRIPLMALANGLASLNVPKQTLRDGNGVKLASSLLERAGLFTILDPIGSDDLICLRKLVAERVRDAEDALRHQNEYIGSGDVSYAEICSRGRMRWDLLLHAGGERQGAGDVDEDKKFDVLERIATDGAWVPVMHALLGAFNWQASVICSRPGAPAGKWHIDGGHSRLVFNGESGQAYAICVFIPLVRLEQPSTSESGVTKHGLGCTAFWPGSHRYQECAHLGAAAADKLGVVIPGAPLEPGAALIYDYRVVHCASPNDAFEMDDGERPILQLTYTFHKYNDIGRNYGYYQLFTE